MPNPIKKIATSRFPTAEFIFTGPEVLRARPAARVPRNPTRTHDLKGGR
ncbi:hypothetical protein E9229_001101 [Paeniglutamicibacter cryotolerans]|uniref:Uncharacterized protein n=1 Tax=Paeniglutamicibacter cryotolerans TaxID=670079 RepID=A0A839QG97_9MICC|nr:hypothetical protein [Paeniglutamicibacter cryotolerans]